MYCRANRVWRRDNLVVLDHPAPSEFFDESRNGVRLKGDYVSLVFDERPGKLSTKGNYTIKSVISMWQVVPLPSVMAMVEAKIQDAAANGKRFSHGWIDDLVWRAEMGRSAIRQVRGRPEIELYLGAINRKDRNLKGRTIVVSDFDSAASKSMYE
ncbi:hypothetical protein CMO91_03925 [Candidatus Woesearchaeota archaeon]|nr:hypothetical protein [Candidatus Woesearchaeota archaeon]|tara:strand:- start:541 stop:1005 length:465 start_codon:yes stop_codon:yes gene_type:complete